LVPYVDYPVPHVVVGLLRLRVTFTPPTPLLHPVTFWFGAPSHVVILCCWLPAPLMPVSYLVGRDPTFAFAPTPPTFATRTHTLLPRPTRARLYAFGSVRLVVAVYHAFYLPPGYVYPQYLPRLIWFTRFFVGLVCGFDVVLVGCSSRLHTVVTVVRITLHV